MLSFSGARAMAHSALWLSRDWLRNNTSNTFNVRLEFNLEFRNQFITIANLQLTQNFVKKRIFDDNMSCFQFYRKYIISICIMS